MFYIRGREEGGDHVGDTLAELIPFVNSFPCIDGHIGTGDRLHCGQRGSLDAIDCRVPEVVRDGRRRMGSRREGLPPRVGPVHDSSLMLTVDVVAAGAVGVVARVHAGGRGLPALCADSILHKTLAYSLSSRC